MARHRIRAADVDDVPVFTLCPCLSRALDDFELRRVAERVLNACVVSPVRAFGTIAGGRERAIRLRPHLERLQLFGPTLDQLAATVDAPMSPVPLNSRVYAGENHSLRLQERLHGAEQIVAIPVLAQSGQVLRVQDVADVTDGPDPDLGALHAIWFWTWRSALRRLGRPRTGRCHHCHRETQRDECR